MHILQATLRVAMAMNCSWLVYTAVVHGGISASARASTTVPGYNGHRGGYT